MGLRRGFKSESATLVKEVRTELGLKTLQGLDPRRLASHLGIPIVALTELSGNTSMVRFFTCVEQGVLSALTVFDGHRRMIVHNDSHSQARQNSNLTHELAHGLLIHEPAPALDCKTDRRDWNSIKELEAAWLGGELLITREMALAVARGRLTRHQAKERFGVSDGMLTWRLNQTGAAMQAQRERAQRKHGARRKRISRAV